MWKSHDRVREYYSVGPKKSATSKSKYFKFNKIYRYSINDCDSKYLYYENIFHDKYNTTYLISSIFVEYRRCVYKL